MTRVAIQGIAGSYSEQAVHELFQSDVSIIECSNFAGTFSALRRGSAQHAMLPVENKIVGEIAEPMGLIRSGEFRVIEKIDLRVRHVLVGTADAEFDELASVRSHIEALKQCRTFLASQPQIRAELKRALR